MMKGREQTATQVLNRGFNSTYTGGDGKELFATDHPTLGADLANEPTVATDLDEAAIEQAHTDISNFKDERGLRMDVRMMKLILPLDLTFDAHRLLASINRVETANNDINAIRDMSLFPDGIVISPYLTDADAWFVKTDVKDGLKFKMRNDITLSNDNDFDTDNAKFKAIMRHDVGWSDPRGAYGSPGA